MTSVAPGTCSEDLSHPRSLLLQWHITSRCNLRCAHCYQEEYGGDELSFQELLGVLDQFTRLVQSLHRPRPHKADQITVTGGEPFLRPDLFDLLKAIAAHREVYSFAVLSNGTQIDADAASRLRKLGARFVQVSLEGGRDTHDAIRGSGNFDRTVVAIEHLVRQRVWTLIAFSAHRGNYREFPEVARLGRELGVRRVWADRVVPWGTGAALRNQVLTPEETREFFGLMAAARRESAQRWLTRTEIAMHRALQFLAAPARPYRCTAGERLIAVQPNGDVYPCRRLPIRVGNLRESSLVDLYRQSELFQALRDDRRAIAGCQACLYGRLCRGGLRCLAYAMTGDPSTADPGCWLAGPDGAADKEGMVDGCSSDCQSV